MKKLIAKNILDWYQANKKSWPWRENPDPYAVWVSEIMAQQTRLATVLPYYQQWMQTFPSIKSLAIASQQDVLAVWEGLGYYSRARNIHKAAKLLVKDYDGKLPNNSKDLQKLPGIGKYTAGAIASMAFKKDAAVVDGNVKRVLARLYSIETEINTSVGEKEIWKIAEDLVPSGFAGDFNQGLMELGAFVCTPTNPKCDICPVLSQCKAFKNGKQNSLPNKKPKDKIPHYAVSAAIITKDKKFLIAQRPEKGLLAGLWEFPGGKLEENESLEQALMREIKEELDCKIEVGKLFGTYKHAYTHFKITLHAFIVNKFNSQPIALEAQQIKWVELIHLKDYPMGKIDRLIANDLIDKYE